jgi:hypothetical protein
MKKLFLCCVASLLLMAPAGANTNRVQDSPANDSTGSMDIEWVQHGHAGKKLAHVISTYDPWRDVDLGDNGVFQINISAGDDRPSLTRIIVIYLDGGQHEAKMFDVAHNGSRVVGYPDVSRPTARSVKVTFPKRWVRWKVQAYRWEAFYAENDVKDTVPSDGPMILHRM